MHASSIRFLRRIGGERSGIVEPGRGVQPETIWLEHPAFIGWEMGVEFSDDAQVTGMTVRAGVDVVEAGQAERDLNEIPMVRSVPRPMTARFMRDIPWGEIEQAARVHLRHARAMTVADVGGEWTGTGPSGARTGSGPVVPGGGERGPATQRARENLTALDRVERNRPGPPTAPDSELVRFAAAYVAALADDATRKSPTAAVAKALGYNVSTVRGRIAECRERRLLTPTVQGKPGGDLTPYAVSLLNDGATS